MLYFYFFFFFICPMATDSNEEFCPNEGVTKVLLIRLFSFFLLYETLSQTSITFPDNGNNKCLHQSPL